MTLGRLIALNQAWREIPPAHVSLARLNSAILKERVPAKDNGPQKSGSLAELMAAFSAAGGVVNG